MSAVTAVPRLTSLSHGGGCGCKLSPGVLADLLRAAPAAASYAALLVGRETADDAAVWQLRGVVQLAQRGMAGSGIVPCI